MALAQADIAFASVILYSFRTLALSADGATQFHNMPYWSIPEAALDDSQEACTLARRTFASLE